jgi:hypothetical protein
VLRPRRAGEFGRALDADRRRLSRRVNRQIERRPIGCSLGLIAGGAVLILLTRVLPLSPLVEIGFYIAGGPLVVFGVLLLLIAMFSEAFGPFVEMFLDLIAPPSHPATEELQPLYDGKFMGYEKGKQRMARTLVQRWAISEKEAADLVDRLEADREIVHSPDGRWQVGPPS